MKESAVPDELDGWIGRIASTGQWPVNPHDARLWSVELDADPAPLDHVLTNLLDEVEIRRSRTFRDEINRRRYIRAHAALRLILGTVVDRPARELAVLRDTNHRPYLSDRVGDLDFNLSHSNGRMLLGVSNRHRIGVDIEAVGDFDWTTISSRVLRSSEREQLDVLPPHERRSAFFKFWTLKEAFLKAVGDGLHRPMTEVEVDIKERNPIVHDLSSPASHAVDAFCVERGPYVEAFVLVRRT